MRLFICALSIAMLVNAACAPVITQPPDPVTSAPSSTPSTPIVTSTPIATAGCSQVTNVQANEVSFAGRIVLLDTRFGLQTLEGSFTVVQPYFNAPRISNVLISPNHERLVFLVSSDLSEEPFIQTQLYLFDRGQEIINTLAPLGVEWAGLEGWLNNELISIDPLDELGRRLIMDTKTMTSARFNIEIVDPFFQESDYAFAGVLPQWDVRVSPNQGWLAYSGYTPNTGFPSMRLWDVINQRLIWQMDYIGAQVIPPSWSSTGDKLAVAGQIQSLATITDDVTADHYELFVVGVDGTVDQLTNFKDNLSSSYIEDLVWSPDSQWIAFWLRMNNENGYRLVTYNLPQQRLTVYCPLPDLSPDPVIWSPDSRQLIVPVDDAPNHREYLFVNVVEQTGFKIFLESYQQATVAGWLK